VCLAQLGLEKDRDLGSLTTGQLVVEGCLLFTLSVFAVRGDWIVERGCLCVRVGMCGYVYVCVCGCDGRHELVVCVVVDSLCLALSFSFRFVFRLCPAIFCDSSRLFRKQSFVDH